MYLTDDHPPTPVLYCPRCAHLEFDWEGIMGDPPPRQRIAGDREDVFDLYFEPFEDDGPETPSDHPDWWRS
jgi:hypothetical protein